MSDLPSSPILYLPIEEQKRELDARLLLAIEALQAGWRVVIGQQWLMVENMRQLRPGVFFFKGMNNVQQTWMQHAASFGHKGVTVDEEVTAIADETFVLKEVSERCLYIVDAVFTQGPNQHEIYKRKFPYHAHKFRMTGNPRFDLLEPAFRTAFQAEAEGLRRKYGRFFLFNTNFGYANSHWGDPEEYIKVCETVGYVKRGDPFDEKWLKDQLVFEQTNLDAFVEAMKFLRDRYPDMTVILRPHPAEYIENWKRRLAGEERILVNADGAPQPWLLAAEALIQSTCTTGIESVMMDRPTIAYCAEESWCEDIFIANNLCPRATDLPALGQLTDAVLADSEGFIAKMKAEHAGASDNHFLKPSGHSVTKEIFKTIKSLGILTDPKSSPILNNGIKADSEFTAFRKSKINLTDEYLTKRFTYLSRLVGNTKPAGRWQLGESLFLLG